MGAFYFVESIILWIYVKVSLKKIRYFYIFCFWYHLMKSSCGTHTLSLVPITLHFHQPGITGIYLSAMSLQCTVMYSIAHWSVWNGLQRKLIINVHVYCSADLDTPLWICWCYELPGWGCSVLSASGRRVNSGTHSLTPQTGS